MIVIKVELHSAVTGKVSEIGRMTICNDGTSHDPEIGNYDIALMRKNTKDVCQRGGVVQGHRRLSLPIWSLVSKALKSVGY